MKKITFILLALISGTVFAQQTNTAKATANVGAEIIEPITIDKDTDLNFGRIIGNAAGGDVTVDMDGARTATNNDLLDPSAAGTSALSAAEFTITAADSYSYDIDIPETVTLTGAGENMKVTLNAYYNDNALSGATVQGSENPDILKVGGVLEVGTNQGQGAYTTSFDVTVKYE